MKDPVLDALKKASKGLQYASETEAGFEPFAWEVEETTLADFFAAVPPEDKAKFDKLARALEGLLSDIKAFKVGGGPEKEAYIVGRAKDGRWAGLKTTVVET